MTREEAIRRIKAWNLDSDDMEVLIEVVPELAESEDERMLREIKRYIKEQGDKPTGLPNGTVAVSDMIAWLEKQKEQKPKLDEVGKLEFCKKCSRSIFQYQRGYDQGLINGQIKTEKEQKPVVSREKILHQLFQNGSITLSDYLYLTGKQKQKWDKFDNDCLNRAIWYIENPAPSVVKDTNLTLWLKALAERFSY